MERLQKYMAHSGLASRRKCEEFIERGKVKINGVVATIGQNVDPTKDVIEFHGRVLKPQPVQYLMLNKPKNVVTTKADSFAPRMVVDLLPKEFSHLYPVGRLDKDAEGLILMTNDGDFANYVMHPRYLLPKTYKVWLDRPVEDEDLHKLDNGIRFKDGVVKTVQYKRLTRNSLEITISVGLHKVVKRLMRHIGYRVTRLLRTKIGELELGRLSSGRFKEVSDISRYFPKYQPKK